MVHDLRAYYNAATADLAAGPDSQNFKNYTGQCLQRTYIMLHSSLGTDASLEIGAHRGEYSLAMANTYGSKISICALEASPRTHAYYAKKVSYKDFGVSYINALVSDREEQIVFNEYIVAGCEPAVGISSLLKRDIRYNHHKQSRIVRSAVQSIRGDTLIERKFKNNKKISLWIDVEGSQYEVLNSLSKSFEQEIINSVYIEVEQFKLWPKQKMLDNDIIEFMNKHNFSQFLRDNEHPGQYNIIFVNNNVKDCNFSLYFEYYQMLLLKKRSLLQ